MCNCCGFDSLHENRSTPVPAAPEGLQRRRYCERCSAVLFSDHSAALFLDKLKLLGQFGLASHTRLLLGTTGENA
jgi:hypothetical protein